MKRHGIVVFFALFAVLGCLLWVGEADAMLFQRQALVATPQAQTWESRPFRRGPVYVRVFTRGRELAQIPEGNCRATYAGAGVAVRVHLRRCLRPGASVYTLRYVALDRPQQRFVLRLTTGG